MSEIKIIKNPRTGKPDSLLIPAHEGFFEHKGFQVLVQYDEEAQEAPREPQVLHQSSNGQVDHGEYNESEEEPQGQERPSNGRRPKVLPYQQGYVPVRVSSSGNRRLTNSMHAAAIFSDGSIERALCDRTENRRSSRQKNAQLSDVNCIRCRKQLERIGWLTTAE